MNKFRSQSGLGRKVVFLLMLTLLMSLLMGTVSASTIQKSAYDTYTYWSGPGRRVPVSSTPMYEFEKTIVGEELGMNSFSGPTDVYVDNEGYIYIMDSVLGRVIILNPDYTLKNVMGASYFDEKGNPSYMLDFKYEEDGFTPVFDENGEMILEEKFSEGSKQILVKDKNGNTLDFAGAEGVYVDNDGLIYIADTAHKQVIITDKEGNAEILKAPSEDIVPANFIFDPIRVVVDSEGYIFVVCKSSYYGAVLYNPDRTFASFYGANSVQTTILDVFSRLYEMIFVTDEQKMNEEKTLPYVFSDIAIDEDDFIYTATPPKDQVTINNGQLKKLSPGGTNVLKNKTGLEVTTAESTNFSDARWANYLSNSSVRGRPSRIVSMDVDEYGYMYGLCQAFGHIFIYDQACNLLSVFGGGVGGGKQDGTFYMPTSIHVVDGKDGEKGKIYVIDQANNNLTVFKETEYGQLVKKAQSYTNAGSYVESKPLWEKVLKMDRNQQLAYRGLARVAIIEEDYETALEYAEKGFDQDTYASAFVYVRNDYLTENFVWIVGLAVLLVGGVLAYFIYLKKKEKKLITNTKLATLFQCVVHPFEGAKQVRYYDNGSFKLANLMLVLYFITSIINDMYTGFMYQFLDKSTYDATFTIIRTVGIVVLWTVVNWALTTLFQGKGKMSQIYMVTCYALLPQIANNIIITILSNVLAPEEQLVMTAISFVFTALTLIMICVGTMTVHEFGFFKFLIMSVVIIFGMLICVFVIVMVLILFQQMFTFIGTLFNEINYR